MEEIFQSTNFESPKRMPREYIMWLALFIVGYSYFALGFDDDPDSCLADESVDEEHRIEGSTKMSSSVADVSADMRFGFRWLLILVLLELCGVLANRFYFVLKERRRIVILYWQRPILLS